MLELAPLAARRAAELGSHREAAAQYERALRWADALPPSERACLHESRSYECYLTGRIEEALSAQERALSIWREVGDKVKVGESHRWLSRLCWYLGRHAAAERHARESLAVLEGAAPGPSSPGPTPTYAQFHDAGRARRRRRRPGATAPSRWPSGWASARCCATPSTRVGTTRGYQGPTTAPSASWSAAWPWPWN